MDKFNKIICVLLSMITILSFVGCSRGDKESEKTANTEEIQTEEIKTEVMFLYGNTRNVAVPDIQFWIEIVEKMAENNAHCSIAVIDGNPRVCDKMDIVLPKKFLHKADSSTLVSEVLKKANASKAQTDEINILSSLALAKEELGKIPDAKKEIIIYSSGISTSVPINFAENPELLNEDIDVVINYLKASESLPDLSGIEISWYGMGNVSNEQSKPGFFDIYRLKSFWGNILEACNCVVSDDTFKSAPVYNDELGVYEKTENYPTVKSVDLSNPISQKKVEFESGTANLKNPELARQALEPLAKQIVQSECTKFYIVGSTASADDNETCLKLSRERAQVVKDILCEYGVVPSFLEVYGIGREVFGTEEEKWHYNDLDPNYNIIEEKAENNRKVQVVPADSGQGENFMALWNQSGLASQN